MAVDCVAAAVFGGAVAFSAVALGESLLAVLLAPAGFALAYTAMARIKDERLYAVAGFELKRIDPPPEAPDVIGDENVVRLFDPRQYAIARPLETNGGGSPDDAGQALSDALAQLKQSLR